MDRQAKIFVLILVVIAVVLLLIFSGLISGIILYVLALLLLFLVGFQPGIIEVKDYERLAVFRLGKLKGIEGPGWIIVLNSIDKHVLVDLRAQAIDIEPQEVISKDNIKFKIDAVIYLKVIDPLKAVIEVKDYSNAVTLLVYSQIRNAVAKLFLEEVIANTDDINREIRDEVAVVAKDWGVDCIKIEIQTIEPPQSLVEAMRRRKEAQEYKARLEIESQAKEIQIDILNRAASKISDTTMAYLYLDSLKRIAEGKSNKIIFPLELSHLASKISSKLLGGNVQEMLLPSSSKSQGAKKAKETEIASPVYAEEFQKALEETQGAKPDYDKIVSGLIEAYRKKQLETVEEQDENNETGESGETKEPLKPRKPLKPAKTDTSEND